MPQERRLVTVLFADIVDSSASVRAHDPEVVREALAAMFARTRDILVSHGGTVEKFIGDAVMAVFGLPVAHEDDAERAIRAALALREDANAAGPHGLRFTFRIGVNSGEVVSGDGLGGGFLATGQPVVVAARLEQTAAPGEILVGPMTRDLTRTSVEYGEPRSVLAKGIGAIEAHPALGAVSAGPREAQATPFVDRAPELQLLGGFFSRATTAERAHLVTVVGDAGVGKSRLVSEFIRATGSPSLRAACLPYGRAITYWPLQELIRQGVGIAPTDDPAAAHAKIEAAVAASVDAERPEVAATSRQLSALAVSGGSESAEAGPSLEQSQELARALRRYLEGRARTSSAILVIEDLHWAEDPLLELIDDLVSRIRAPLLMVCAARPELLDRPPWRAGRANALTIDLEPLDDDHCYRLVGELIGDRRDRRIRTIVERTEGNPLFAGEYVRALAERRPEDVPATLHGVIAARLDSAPAGLRRLLQEASVLGRDFWADALPGPADGGDRAAQLDEGLRRDLVERPAGVSGPSGTRTYRFKHGLIRDVAYASLSKADRALLHDHYAEWLASAGERAQDYAEIVLYHSERAFELAREVNSPTASALGRRAFASLRRTATLASARADSQLALELCGRGLALADLVGVAADERADLLGLAAIARIRLESSEEAIAELDRAIDAARPLPPTMGLVRLLTWRASSSAALEDIVGAQALYAEAVDVAKRTGDHDAISYAMWSSAEPLQLIGQLAEHRRYLEEALAYMRANGSDRWVGSALVQLSGSALAMGDAADARARGQEALEIAERSGRLIDRYLALQALGRALLAAGDPAAREVAEKTLAMAGELGGPATLSFVADMVAEAMERAGEHAAAEAFAAGVLARLDPVRTPTLRADIARLEAIRARLALGRDDIGAAAAAAETAMRVAPRSDVGARVRALIAATSVARAEGRDDEARRLASEARGILEPTDHRVLKAAVDGLFAAVGQTGTA